jgi:RNA polymerase sigma factor (sigma-70 family)
MPCRFCCSEGGRACEKASRSTAVAVTATHYPNQRLYSRITNFIAPQSAERNKRMATFLIQSTNGTTTEVGHDEFYKILNGADKYFSYKQGHIHVATPITEENAEAVKDFRKSERAESDEIKAFYRCRNQKGQMCRYQHGENGAVIRNAKGNPVDAKCSDCPRDGWQTGNKDNCCLRNYCKIKDCVYCPHPRECHAPISLDWLEECGLDDDDWIPELQLFGGTSDGQAQLEREELRTALYEAISDLPANEQSLIQALFWKGVLKQDFAAANGISPMKVSRMYKRSVEALKNKLKSFQ